MVKFRRAPARMGHHLVGAGACLNVSVRSAHFTQAPIAYKLVEPERLVGSKLKW